MPKSKSKSSRKKPNNHRAHDTARKRRASPFLRSLPVRPKQLEYLRERAKSHLTKMFLGTADKLDLVFLNYLFEATGPLCANFDAADDIMAELERSLAAVEDAFYGRRDQKEAAGDIQGTVDICLEVFAQSTREEFEKASAIMMGAQPEVLTERHKTLESMCVEALPERYGPEILKHVIIPEHVKAEMAEKAALEEAAALAQAEAEGQDAEPAEKAKRPKRPPSRFLPGAARVPLRGMRNRPPETPRKVPEKPGTFAFWSGSL